MAAGRTRRPARLPGIVLALLLALFGTSGAVAHGQDGHGQTAYGQTAHGAPAQSGSADSAYHHDAAQHLKNAVMHPAHAATHAPLPLLPSAGASAQEPRRALAAPRHPQPSAAHLTRHSPRHERAPPAVQAREI